METAIKVVLLYGVLVGLWIAAPALLERNIKELERLGLSSRQPENTTAIIRGGIVALGIIALWILL